jgi:hypothetical protein
VHGSKVLLASSLDGGSSRDHVQYLLQILFAIISGFQSVTIQEDVVFEPPAKNTQDRQCDSITEECDSEIDKEYHRSAVGEGKLDGDHDHRWLQHKGSKDSVPVQQSAEDIVRIRQSLLFEGLFPLHKPNEMVLWRDQIPIIQSYHEYLVKCIVGICDRTFIQTGDVNDQGRKSLLVHAIIHLLDVWPDAYDTNTPKQVLLLHELEILLERCSVEEFVHVQDKVLVSCHSIDTLFLFCLSWIVLFSRIA